MVRVLTSQRGFTRPSSINFSLGIVRDIVPPIIHRRKLGGVMFAKLVLLNGKLGVMHVVTSQ